MLLRVPERLLVRLPAPESALLPADCLPVLLPLALPLLAALTEAKETTSVTASLSEGAEHLSTLMQPLAQLFVD